MIINRIPIRVCLLAKDVLFEAMFTTNFSDMDGWELLDHGGISGAVDYAMDQIQEDGKN